jgi:hypothetical protein
MHRSIYLLSFFIIITSHYSCKDSSAVEEVPKTNTQLSVFDDIYALNRPTITLKGDLSHLFETTELNEDGNEEYYPAELIIEKGDGSVPIPLRIAKRGITRKRICEFPPIKLKFYSDSLEVMGYSHFNTYKLVTHCIESLEELVIREYLTYKLYNHFTDNSFRVQLVNIRYEDESGKIDASPHYAFIIEEDEELANRLGAALVEDPIKTIDRQQYAEMVVFQYMIGNTDWNLTGGHNMKWIKSVNVESPTPVPYDFDFCGLVNAPHAAPHPQMPIKTVRERLLQWRGKTKDELKPICDAFIADKANIISIVNDFPELSQFAKEDMVQYLESFFAQIEKGEI